MNSLEWDRSKQMKGLNFKLIFGLVGMAFFSSLNAFEITNLAQAVNEAGRQRMLTQRLLKDYAMIGLGNTFKNPSQDLKNIMKMFDEHLTALTNFAIDPETQNSLNRPRKLWEPIKKMLQKTPTKRMLPFWQGN